MSGQVAVRPLTLDDVPALTAPLAANRDHLAPWDPLRPDEYWTEEFQRHDTARLLDLHRLGAVLPGEAGLHRLRAGPLLPNAASQRVLRKGGSTPIGVAPRYPCIAGRWQDHVLFQLLHEPGMR